MRRALVVCLVVFVLGATMTFPGTAKPGDGALRRYVVVLENGPAPAGALRTKVSGVEALAREHASRFGVGVSHVYKWAFDGYAADMSDRVAVQIANDPRVAWVEPVYRIDAPADRPIRLLAEGRSTRQILPTGADRVQADRSSTSKIDGVDERVNVDVAVVDTGIDVDHPDLNVAGGTSCVAESSFDDGHGHGTRVGGVIGALDNGYGVVGVAPGVCIRSTYFGGRYAMASETSISAPHVTGGAALYKATHPTSSSAEVRAALIENGRFNWNARQDPDRRKEPLLNVATF